MTLTDIGGESGWGFAVEIFFVFIFFTIILEPTSVHNRIVTFILAILAVALLNAVVGFLYWICPSSDAVFSWWDRLPLTAGDIATIVFCVLIIAWFLATPWLMENAESKRGEGV